MPNVNIVQGGTWHLVCFKKMDAFAISKSNNWVGIVVCTFISLHGLGSDCCRRNTYTIVESSSFAYVGCIVWSCVIIFVPNYITKKLHSDNVYST